MRLTDTSNPVRVHLLSTPCTRAFTLAMALFGCAAPRTSPAVTPASPHAERAVAPAPPPRRCESGDGATCYAAGLAIRNRKDDDLVAAEEATRLFARGCDAGVQDSCAEEGRSFAWGLGTTADADRGAKMLDAACARGSKVGCRWFGELLRQGVGVAQDLPRAETLLGAACEGGTAQACNEEALVLDEKTPKPEDEIRALYKKACDGGFAYGCRNSALRDTSLEPGAVLALLERACAGDAAGACSDLGSRYRNGTGVPRDVAEAARKFDRACEGGDVTGCHWLASFVRAGTGVARDPARAAILFARACDKGAEGACSSLALMVDTGEGTDADPMHARELRERACRAHQPGACAFLAETPSDRTDDERNDARRRVDALCNEGKVAEACLAIGKAAVSRHATGGERARQVEALSKACDLGSAAGCGLLADRLDRDRPSAVDIARAASLREKACDHGWSDACRALAKMVRAGRGVARDPARARKLEERASDDDD